MVVRDAPALTAGLVGQPASASTPREGEMQARPIHGARSGDRDPLFSSLRKAKVLASTFEAIHHRLLIACPP